MTPATHSGITVVIPLYQAEPYIAEALDSIRAQTLRPDHVIVVDDGSTDNGPALVAARSDVELVRRPHQGIPPTMQAGLALARSEFIAFLDADDRWLSGKLALQHAYLHAHPDLAMVFGHARRFVMTDSGERILDTMPGLSGIGGLFRRSAFDRVPLLSENAGNHWFIDWYNRAHEAGLASRLLPDLVCERRIHDTNHSIVCRDDQRRTYFTAIKAKLERARAAS